MTGPRLILFDVDGTLVDSQGAILGAMGAAFAGAGVPMPPRGAVLGIVGLSLPRAMAVLAPDRPAKVLAALEAGYRAAYAAQRAAQGAAAGSPLYPGTAAMLTALAAAPHTVLGVATGKSARGLSALLQAHGLTRLFATTQVADFHPSKPHPSMIETAMAETGAAAARTVMIGDTSFDMQMAAAAGVAAIGVGWGYHPATALTGARCVLKGWDGLAPALAALQREAA